MAVRPVEAADVPAAVRSAQEKLSSLAGVAKITGDPSGPILEALAEMAGALAEAVQEIRQAKQPEAVMTDKQVAQLGRQVAGASNAAARDLARSANLRSIALMIAAGVAMFGSGGLAVWLLTPKPPMLTCSDQRGGIACGYWVSPPTEPAVAPAQTAPGRH
jgi:hypothetical protein